MADTPVRLSGPALLTASPATVYTVPALTTTILRSVHVTNETASTATFTMSVGTDASGKRLWTGLDIETKTSFDWSGFIVLAAGEVVQAFSGTASALTLTTSGVQVA